MNWFFRTVSLLLIAGVAGCSGGGQHSSREVRTEALAEEFGSAVVRHQWKRLELGAREAETYLMSGWSRPEGRFIWSTGRRSILRFFRNRSSALRMELTGHAFVFPESPQQEVLFLVNGEEIGRHAMSPSGEETTFSLLVPERIVRRDNVLELRFSVASRPVDVLPGSNDTRALAVAWSEIRIQDPASPSAGEIGKRNSRWPWVEGDRIELSQGFSLDYAFYGSGRPVLEWDGIEVETEGLARIRGVVWPIESTGSSGRSKPAQFLFESEGKGPYSVAFPMSSFGWRVRLSAEVVEGTSATVGLVNGRVRFPDSHQPFSTGSMLEDATERGRPNVLVYLVDTLRADRLSVYGGKSEVSPRIQEFAEESTVFRRAEAHASWTRATVASLMSGLEPPVHGTLDRDHGLPNDVVLLPELLQGLGYDTKAVFTNSNAGPDAGFDRGFANVDHLREQATPRIHQSAGQVTDLAVHWLKRRDRSRPFFLYLHSSDPHDPYLPGREDRRSLGAVGAGSGLGTGAMMRRLERGIEPVAGGLPDQLQGLYDAEILGTDRAFGELVDSLKELGLWRSTLVILIADHGEEFFEHGQWTHAKTLHSEVVSIPLIIKFPGLLGRGTIVESIARQIDILPTVMEVVGDAPTHPIQGRSLTGRSRDSSSEFAFAFHDLAGNSERGVRWQDNRLLVRRLSAGGYRLLGLFDLALDPKEQQNRLIDQIGLAHFLEGVLTRHEAELPSAKTPISIAPEFEVQQQLEALGYL